MAALSVMRLAALRLLPLLLLRLRQRSHADGRQGAVECSQDLRRHVDGVVACQRRVLGDCDLRSAAGTGLLDDLDEPSADLLLGVAIRMLYYIGLESLTGVTIGKLVTGTVVVNERGQRPTTGQVVGRSFAPIIPFDPFSFLSMTSGGWHDTLSKTHVVKKKALQLGY